MRCDRCKHCTPWTTQHIVNSCGRQKMYCLKFRPAAGIAGPTIDTAGVYFTQYTFCLSQLLNMYCHYPGCEWKIVPTVGTSDTKSKMVHQGGSGPRQKKWKQTKKKTKQIATFKYLLVCCLLSPKTWYTSGFHLKSPHGTDRVDSVTRKIQRSFFFYTSSISRRFYVHVFISFWYHTCYMNTVIIIPAGQAVRDNQPITKQPILPT